MTNNKINGWVEEIARDFSVVKTPQVVTEEGRKKYYKDGAVSHLEICPTISRSFPIVYPRFGSLDALGHFNWFFFEKLPTRKLLNNFPQNTQQNYGLRSTYGIETAGKLIEGLKKWARGEDYVTWEPSVESIKTWRNRLMMPFDTRDNGFVYFYRDAHCFLDSAPLETRVEDSGIDQLRKIPKEKMKGYFLLQYSQVISGIIEKIEGVRKESFDSTGKRGLEESLCENKLLFMRYFEAIRNLHEVGAKALNETEATAPLLSFPTWKAPHIEELSIGDYIQGTFLLDKNLSSHDGIIKRKEIQTNGDLIVDLEYAGRGDGLGKKEVKDLRLIKNHYLYQLWKFEHGNYFHPKKTKGI